MRSNLVAARAAAEQRMKAAKRSFSEAARAALAGEQDAPALAEEAYRAIQSARWELELLRSGQRQ